MVRVMGIARVIVCFVSFWLVCVADGLVLYGPSRNTEE